jgi:hypothetical protein
MDYKTGLSLYTYCLSVTVIGNQSFKLLVKEQGQDTKTDSYLYKFNLADNNNGIYTCQDVTTLDLFQKTSEQNVKFVYCKFKLCKFSTDLDADIHKKWHTILPGEVLNVHLETNYWQ